MVRERFRQGVIDQEQTLLFPKGIPEERVLRELPLKLNGNAVKNKERF